jgi:FAS-associated factor 2
MDSLDDIQRHAVLQLRELINGADEDVAVGVLSSVEWDVQVCLSTNLTQSNFN